MKKLFKPKWIISVICILAITYYLYVLILAKQELSGEKPEKNKFASIDNPVQRAKQQSCTGIYTTPKNTWLVSRDDSTFESNTYERPVTSYNLNILLPKEDENQAESYLGLKADKNITYISKLDQNGKFTEVARLNGIGCLITPPDGESLLILTDINTPYKIEEQHQMAVLRSDDQGKSWQWQKEGFFKPVYFQSWTLEPTIYNRQNTWLWREESEDQEGKTIYLGHETGKPSGLYFSPDLGKTIEPIQASAPILVQLKDIKHKASKNVEWLNPELSGVKAFVTQWSDHDATLWVSQTYSYNSPDSYYIEGVKTTTKVKLKLIDKHWKMGEIQHIDGMAIENVMNTPNGKFISIQSFDDKKQNQIAVLDKNDNNWIVQGSLPKAFYPFNDLTHAEYVWTTNNTIFISTVSNHQIYRILRPTRWFSSESAGDVSAFGTYASNDLGKSWHKLDIDAPNGILGVDPKNNLFFWADSPWYKALDNNIYKAVMK